MRGGSHKGGTDRSPGASLLTVKTIRGAIGRDRYVVKRIRRKPYLYLRRYDGAAGHARPVYRDLYLGPVPGDVLGDPERLGALASARRRLRRKEHGEA
jgi:hypothetical protein